MWLRDRRPSPAMVVAVVALFVALSGVSYAALSRNSVGAKQIKTDAVRRAEVKANAIRTAEIKDGAVGSLDVADNALVSGDVQDDTLTSSDVHSETLIGQDVQDGSLTGADVQDESLGSADVQGLVNTDLGSGESVTAFARVQADGTLLPNVGTAFPPTAKGVDQTDIAHTAATGVYCFDELGFQPTSALVTSDNVGASTAVDNAWIASVAVERGNSLGGCAAGADARVVTTNVDPAQAAAANSDHGFVIWFIR